MAFETNKLVGKVGRIAVPAGAAAGLVLAAGMLVHHNGVHAAMISPAAPMDDNSVSSLVALDNAVESVAARVTPAVVNVAVTSRGSSEHEVGEEQEQGQDQGQGQIQGLPPGFSQFFGQGLPGMQRPQQPQIEHGNERLTAGEDAGVVAILGKQRQRFLDRIGPHVIERSGFHLRGFMDCRLTTGRGCAVALPAAPRRRRRARRRSHWRCRPACSCNCLPPIPWRRAA